MRWTSHTQVQPNTLRHTHTHRVSIWGGGRGTFLLQVTQLLLFLVKTTQRHREPTHREHIYPGMRPDNYIPMDLLGGGENCRAHFTRKYSELDVAYSLFYSLSFLSLLCFSCIIPSNHIRLSYFL